MLTKNANYLHSSEYNDMLNVSPGKTRPSFQHQSDERGRYRCSGACACVTFCAPCTSLLCPISSNLCRNKQTSRTVIKLQSSDSSNTTTLLLFL